MKFAVWTGKETEIALEENALEESVGETCALKLPR